MQSEVRPTQCDGCDGSGIRFPATPSCDLPRTDRWIVVERCDACEKYRDDLEAALSTFQIAQWSYCSEGGRHALALPSKKLWQAYFEHVDTHSVREELKLNRADIGWYQIRKALQARNESGDFVPVSFDAFHAAYKALTDKLQPMVYELGFLKG